jgi:hypothetical protein
VGDSINTDWEHDPRVEILHVLDDIGQPYSCTEWGSGLNGVPIINGTTISDGVEYKLFDLFEHPGDGLSRPLVVFINYEMEIIYIDNNHIIQSDAYDLIQLMLNSMPDMSTPIDDNTYFIDNFNINQLYPNPFNPVLQINYDIPQAGVIQVEILDISGSHIETLHSGFLQSGSQKISWNAESMPSGMYLVSLKSGDKSLTEKVVLLK